MENIEFVGKKNRHELNEYINYSKFGLVTSNLIDGCPRISTEILATGTPLLIRNLTRLLNYYKLKSIRIFDDSNLEKVFMKSFNKYEELRQKNLEYLKSEFNDAVVVVPPADEIRLGAARDAASRARSMCVVCVRAECGERYAALSHPGQ